jgi:D-alanine transaminase
MSRIAYVNGAYVPHALASVHVEDRGYQFADGVYEVWAVRGGRLLEHDGHMNRLERSLRELRIAMPMSRPAFDVVIRETARRNQVRDGMVYLQITRGVAPRDHVFPSASVLPSVVVTAKRLSVQALNARATNGVAVVTVPDIRWDRCDIKSTALLPNVLAKQEAKERGGFEAWLVDERGYVTEGSSTTAWIVSRDGALITRPLDNHILPGVTRDALINLARAMQIKVEERAFTVAEAQGAPEAFISSASGAAVPVVQIDGVKIGNGAPGPVAARLRDAYLAQS